jgi:hypothetical protein
MPPWPRSNSSAGRIERPTVRIAAPNGKAPIPAPGAVRHLLDLAVVLAAQVPKVALVVGAARSTRDDVVAHHCGRGAFKNLAHAARAAAHDGLQARPRPGLVERVPWH